MSKLNEVKKELTKIAGSCDTDEDGFHKDTLAVINQLQADKDLMGTQIEEQREEIERLQGALERLGRWAKAYPLSVFPEPDFVKVREALKAVGISLDVVSASNMRHVIKGVSDIVEQALKK